MSRWLLPLLILAGLALGVDDAFARMGGGGDFGGGGGSSGSGGGGGEAILFELIIRLLLWLCLEHPIVGIPLTLAVVGGFIYVQMQRGKNREFRSQEASYAMRANHSRLESGASGFEPLRARDPNFSQLLFEDLAQLVYRRALEARGTGDFSVISPYLAPAVLGELKTARPGQLTDVIIGASRLRSPRVTGDVARIQVDFESNVTEDGVKLYRRELWQFRRAVDALSPGPDRMTELRCVHCGSPMETDTAGNCGSCGTPLADGRLQWQVESMSVLQRRPVTAPELTRGGGIEHGTNLPTRVDPRLVPELRALCARHPDFEPGQFTPWVASVFVKLQEAWSELRWERARPYLSDPLFQSLRYRIEQYRQSGYRNHGADIQVQKIEYVRASLDPYYEAITLRIRASMLDWTTSDTGAVVGGSKSKARTFSEYWTFVRAVGSAKGGVSSVEQCPSCAGPLDRVNLGGVCGYCGTRISAAEHSWVLSKITQDELYAG